MNKTCVDCNNQYSLTEFYNNKDHSDGKMSYCKKCFNKRVMERWIKRKIKAIEYKGGQCMDCNLQLSDSHYCVFDFHHLDPNTKEYDWNKLRLRSWEDIEYELDKCVLLCANCHRLRHVLIEGFPDQSEFTQSIST